MSVESQETKVARTVEDCEAYWLLSGIPRPTVEEMQLELGQHLREATRAGKPVGAVVGDDLGAFAEAWARENRPGEPLGERALGLVSTALVCAVAVLAARRAFPPSLAFPLSWPDLAPIPPIVLAAEVLLRPPVARWILVGPWWKRLPASGGVAISLLAVAVAASLAGRALQPPALLVWSWPLTLFLAAVALALLWFRVRRDPTAPARRAT